MTNEKRSPTSSARSISNAGTQGDRAFGKSELHYRVDSAESIPSTIHGDKQANVGEGIHSFSFQELTTATAKETGSPLDLVQDVELNLRIELGRTHLPLKEVVKLDKGSVVALDRLAGEPVDVYANDCLIARGEIVVVNNNFSVRVTELINDIQAA